MMFFLGFVFLCAFGFQALRIYDMLGKQRGDGYTVESYGYDLSNLTISRDLLVSSGVPKDGHLTLNHPPAVAIEEVDAQNDELRTKGRWGRIVVSDDEVIGVAINGQARAYPVRYIQWHDLINDTLGQTPIAVTYHPLCVSAVVFDRRVGGVTHEFGFSGLLYNSNIVLYDKQDDPAKESLWCQLTFGPIAGPAVSRGERLTVLPMYVGPFGKWRELHPSTSVFAGDARLKSKYKQNPFLDYYQKQEYWFPVKPQVPADAPFKPFDPVMAVQQPDGTWNLRPYKPSEDHDAPTDRPNVLTFYFAWHAIRENAVK